MALAVLVLFMFTICTIVSCSKPTPKPPIASLRESDLHWKRVRELEIEQLRFRTLRARRVVD